MKDKLARKIYADKIATEIDDCYVSQKASFDKGDERQRENLIFAISGKWGEGKTALLRLLAPLLEKKGYKVIWFNPWKYSQEDITLKRAFLGSLKDQLDSYVNLDDLYFDRTKTTLNFDWRFVIKWSVIGFVLYVFAFPAFFGLSSLEWLKDSNALLVTLINLPLIKPLLTLILIPIVLEIITISRRGANVSTAEEFEVKFVELLEDKQKIVIFIDDLDRCTAETVKIILDSLRTFFQHPECSYVITGDHTVIERFAGNELDLAAETSNSKKLQEGRRFLKKLFDVYWRMPLSTPYQFGVFVDDEISNSKIEGLTPEQIENIRSFLTDDSLFERNPRHVKRFLTKLRFALEGVILQKNEIDSVSEPGDQLKDAKNVLKDILENPDLLAKVLLFEEFLYPIYERLNLYPESLIHHEKALRTSEDPSALSIGEETVISILGEKEKDDLERYLALVKKSPKFTDESNSTIHEVANYFSFSGSTGLPSMLGPDESNFEQYLKSGELDDKLGAILEVSQKEKKDAFFKKTLTIFDQAATTEIQKVSIMREALKLSARLDEWAVHLSDLKQRMFALPPDNQNALARDFWLALLIKKPDLLKTVKSEQVAYFASFWSNLSTFDKTPLSDEAVISVENLLKEDIAQSPPNLRGLDSYFAFRESKSLEGELIKYASDPTKLRVYLDQAVSVNPKGKTVQLLDEKLKKLLSEFENFEWGVVNKDYIKTRGLFDAFKSHISKWSSSLKQLITIADRKDQLELTDEEKNILDAALLTQTGKSAELAFLENTNVQNLLKTETKKRIFEALKNVLKDVDDPMEKRKKAAELLLKTNPLWTFPSNDDVQGTLKEIKKMKLGKFVDLKDKPKEILNSWSYNDPAEDEDSK